MDQLTIARPDDWHLHLRDGEALRAVVLHTAQRFGRAVVMPNLKPPVTTVSAALAYRSRIHAALPPDCTFNPLMALYLTDNTPVEDVDRAADTAGVIGFKYYPAGATTNSDAGVTDLARVYPVLERMEERGVPFLVHGEVTDGEVDVFDRERVFIERTAAPLVRRFPRLRLIFEHATTLDAVQFVRAQGAQVAATLTPQHLLNNRTDMFRGGLRPHLYCLPVLKRERDREALLDAATSGSPKFFLGTDSAPHAKHLKEHSCGCAGVYSAHAGIELYAEAFDSVGKLDRLEGFASHFGADYYGLPRNTSSITLRRNTVAVPASFPFAGGELVPYRAGESLAWELVTGGCA
jgi:dihydroorotase